MPYQVSQVLGKTRRSSDRDDDRELHSAKRFAKQPPLSYPLAYRYPKLPSANSPIPVMQFILAAALDGTSNSYGADSTSKPEVQFHQFARLPMEIRLKIWRETWEHREVEIERKSLGTRVPWVHAGRVITTYRGPAEISTLRFKHIVATRRVWGIGRRDHESFFQGMSMQDDFFTYTQTSCKRPVSLWVNRESRLETLKYFEYALALPDGFPNMGITGEPLTPEHLPGGLTSVFFNFDLDVLAFPLHSPLSTAFSRSDLSRVRRVSFPELVPVLPEFTVFTGRFDPRVRFRIVKSDDERPANYPEFENVWQMIRRFFPALREIRLKPFYKCGRYPSTKVQPVREFNLLPNDPAFDSFYADRHCNSCMNIQNSANRRFRKIGVKIQPGSTSDYLRCELDRMLDAHGIMDPVFKEETLVIGTVPGEKKGEEDEEVTVTFQTFHDRCPGSGSLDLSKRKIDWDLVKRKCVARSLQHSLGPPLTHDYMVYCIGAYLGGGLDWID
ncbi:hypothetical protein F4776DRAFT_670714 [Hypoxylon sp. NC0597]|nr:hypothetical protein F4776DRAFT_670714 [Hypoxylon sp. NC0597]